MAYFDTFVFHYRGLMNWKRIVVESARYFKERNFEFHETAYKDKKSDEFEGTWKASQYVDMYHQVIIDINFHAIDMQSIMLTEDGKQVSGYNGKLWVMIKIGLNTNYDYKSPAGKKVIFAEDSWLHKVYKKVTARDTDELILGIPYTVAQGYLALLKQLCKMETNG